MAAWHVSGSESEGERKEEEGIEVGGLWIPPCRVAELLQTIEKRKALELECLSDSSAREKRRKHKKRKRKMLPSPGTSKSLEEVSETASELRSTTSTDLREGRWTNVSKFDYFHEDSSGSDLALAIRSKKLPPEHRKKKLASLDRIVADMRQQKEQYQEQQSTTPEIALDYQHHTPHTAQHHDRDAVFQCVPMGSQGPPPVIGGVMHREHSARTNADKSLGMVLPKFSFGDDSDLDSPNSDGDMKMSVLSQINRVEKLLDDGLT